MDHLVSICYELFNAGADTSSTTLAWGILFMTLNQEVQEKVSKEIKTHLGSRLPNQDDLSRLVFLTFFQFSKRFALASKQELDLVPKF